MNSQRIFASFPCSLHPKSLCTESSTWAMQNEHPGRVGSHPRWLWFQVEATGYSQLPCHAALHKGLSASGSDAELGAVIEVSLGAVIEVLCLPSLSVLCPVLVSSFQKCSYFWISFAFLWVRPPCLLHCRIIPAFCLLNKMFGEGGLFGTEWLPETSRSPSQQ